MKVIKQDCPLVSIIVPIFNVEGYLEECVKSLLLQTYEKIEIILVDDGSTDDSPIICDSLAKQDRRIKVLHKENEGVSVARNRGLELSSGEWVVFVDGDDYASTLMIEKLLDRAIESGADISIGDFYVVRANGQVTSAGFKPREKDGVYSEYELLRFTMLGSDEKGGVTCLGVPWAKIYKKSFLNKNNMLFPVGIKRNQDVIFNLYAFHSASVVSYTSANVYYYRLRKNSAVKSYSPDYPSTVERVLCEIFEFYRTEDIGDYFVDFYYKRLRDMFFECVFLTILHPDCTYSYPQKYRTMKSICENKRISIIRCPDNCLKTNQVIQKRIIQLHLYITEYALLWIRSLIIRFRG